MSMRVNKFTVPLIGWLMIWASPGIICGQIDFNRQIRPILSRHCSSCHGPDEASREADLRLDTFAGATADLGDYAAVVPGDPQASELMLRIMSDDDPMPPEDHGARLTKQEIDSLRQWISEGAAFQKHWAFKTPMQPAIPSLPNQPWAKQPIDAFIYRELQSRGWQPNEAADPARLIRRLALDLTGLPPSREMVERFVAQPNERTYEALVDELLSSPAYGEHWASMWLDLARYADTVGYASDENRTIWPWRDWLIQSLNENKPFDLFTTEIIAGDLLPDPSTEQRLATAFHRNTLNNNEGGTNDEEFRTIAVKDRINTTFNTWMGLTMRCAECHSHKYDPISHTEYYQFLDFFNQTADADRPNETPLLGLRPIGLNAKIEAWDEKIAALRKQQREQPHLWQPLHPVAWASQQGTTLEPQSDLSIQASGLNPDSETWDLKFTPQLDKPITAIRIELLPDAYHAGRVGRGPDGAVVLTQVNVSTEGQNQPLAKAAADYSQKGFEPVHLIRSQIADANEALGWAVHHPTEGFGKRRTAIVEFKDPLVPKKEREISVQLVFNSQWPRSNGGRIRFSYTTTPGAVEKFQRNQLEPLKQQLQRLVKQRNAEVKVPILAELPEEKRRQTHLMKRGNFQNLGDPVTAKVPVSFHEFSPDYPINRLGLARWLLQTDNPLTSRVAVNRLWSRLFGKGLVVTEEDFGTQGSPPSHPDLLDWLATDLQSHAWDIQRSLKQMVMSRTYRQASKITAEKLQADPSNTYWARGPRFRLPAETIRDQALAVSGLLSDKMYGPPVYPPNPIKQVTNAFAGADVWTVSPGEDRYRRSIYTFLKRSQPHPLFETFDTSTRDVCSMRRINTNTPLQSFMTLNDEAFVEAAQALAIQMSQADTPALQISRGLEMALVRAAEPAKIPTLLNLYQKSLEQYTETPAEARLMLGAFANQHAESQHPHLASLVIVANVILNLDEFLTH
ncbi:MAG: PSD1 and planctomycete cytochrome C domain-containing protein [Pirellulaceae bacterium]|nr:PSD1 and planctomycete cytochrome C domain-containing protein [Pirellulaceae bacterium]